MQNQLQVLHCLCLETLKCFPMLHLWDDWDDLSQPLSNSRFQTVFFYEPLRQNYRLEEAKCDEPIPCYRVLKMFAWPCGSSDISSLDFAEEYTVRGTLSMVQYFGEHPPISNLCRES